MQRETVLLLGNYRLSLAVARQLGDAGHGVIVGSDGVISVAKSRHVEAVWHHPDIFDNGKEFLIALKQFLSDHPQVSILLPVSELYLLKLLKIANKIPIPMAAVDRQTVETCCDKGRMAQLAADLDIPQAPFALADNWDDLLAAAKSVGFPCVARPNDGRNYKVKAYFLNSMDHLHNVFPHWPDGHTSLLVQAHAAGLRYNRYFVAESGTVLNYIDVRINRTDRVDGSGYAVEGISLAPMTILHTPSERLVKSLNYTGIGCIQYLVDERLQQASFLEINPRLGGNYAFPHWCGFDQVQPLLAMARGKSLTPCKTRANYKLNKRYIWLYGDIIGLMKAINSRQVGPRGALSWFAKMCRALLRADMHLTLDWRDIKPSLWYASRVIEAFIALSWNLAQALLRRIRSTLKF